MSTRYAYFAGCSAQGTCQELDLSTRAVAAAFDVDLVALENPGCTGARQFRAVSETLFLAASGRILALAEATGADLAVVCDTCLLNLTEANQRLVGDADARARVNALLSGSGLEYHGGVEVKHFLWILMDDVGESRLRERVVRPLAGLRVAPFYGCHLLRPGTAYSAGSRSSAGSLERLCEWVGAEPVANPGASLCCGFHGVLHDEGVSLRLTGARLAEATGGDAHCMVTPCPLCHTMLDGFQPQASRAVDAAFHLPVLHVAQLVGLAIGLDPDALGLARHGVATAGLLAGR